MNVEAMPVAEVETIAPLILSPWQERVLLAPEDVDLALLGGRGGGKSTALAALAIRHCAEHGNRARVLFVRQSFPGLLDLDSLLRELIPRAFEGASYNMQQHIWRLPSGATIELGQLESPADLTRYQGRNFSLLLADEAGEWPDLALVDRLRANLRSSGNVPVRLVLAGNPGGPGHAGLAQRFALRQPWVPFLDTKSGREFVLAPSTLRDNPYLDGDGYERQLIAATAGDPELGKAWIAGDWTVARGAFFASVLSDQVLFGPWDAAKFPSWEEVQQNAWDVWLAHDFGVAAPSVTFVVARSPGGRGPDSRFYPRDSILLLDELATCEPGSLTKGLGYTVPVLADAIRELSARWGMKSAHGVADDAIFARTGSSAGSISEEFAAAGVTFAPARKADRRTGWERMRRMLGDAGRPDKPGLYVSRACEYFWATVPSLPRDPKRIDDVDSRGADHAADAARYALLGDAVQTWRFSTVPWLGI